MMNAIMASPNLGQNPTYGPIFERMLKPRIPEEPNVKNSTTYKPEYSWNYEVGSTTLVTLDGLNITGTERPPYWDESKKTTTIHISSGADLIPGNIIFGYNLDANGVEHDKEEVIKVSDFKGPITDKMANTMKQKSKR